MDKVTVTLDSADDEGVLLRLGSCRIFLSARIPVPGGGPLLEQKPVRATFDGSGAPVVGLYPNDLLGPLNDDDSPGTMYTIYYDGTGAPMSSWSFYVLSTDVNPKLSGYASVPAAAPGAQYLPKTTGPPAAGQLPVFTGDGYATALGNPGAGTVTSVNGVDPVDGGVTLAAADVGAASTGALSSEAATRASADTSLGAAITSEAATRGAADTTLSTAVSSEATRAEAAEATLSAGVAASASASALTAEVSRAEGAEGTLSTAISTEVTRAEAAEGTLSTAVSTEATSRATADALLIPLTQKGANSGVATLDTSGHVPASQLTAANVPTLNQNTSGTAGNLSGTPAVPNGTTATTQTAADNSTKLATTAYADGAVSTEKTRAQTAEGLLIPLTQRGAPSGVATLDSGTHIPAAQLPAATTSAQGAVILDGTASDIQPAGTAAAAGSTGKAADAGHVHAGLSKLAGTSLSGYALVNGTGTIISWTAPSDGNLHRVQLMITLHVTSAETGGQIQVGATMPDGNANNFQVYAGGFGVSFTAGGGGGAGLTFMVQAGTTFTLKQSTALTAGAATLWAEIWGS